MMHELQSWPFQDPTDSIEISDGDSFFKCNFSGDYVDKVIMAGKKDLSFLRCNMHNIKQDPTWKTDGLCRVTKADMVKEGEKFSQGKKRGRYSQKNILSKSEMKSLAHQIKHTLLKEYKRGAINDISKHKPKPSKALEIR